jgi:hypothetical protein
MAIIVLVCRENDTAKKRAAPIVHSKMDFSLQFWEQKQPVFLQCTQCNDPRDTAHTWWEGEGFPGAARVLVEGAMVKNVLSTAFSMRFILVPVWGLSPNWYQYETRRKCCRQDIFQVADVSCLENIVSVRLGTRFLNPQT